jgi:xylan 1,4-beta-xylosidase
MKKTLLLLAAMALLAACAAPPPPAPPPPPPPPAPAIAHFEQFAYQGQDAVYDAKKAGPKDYLNPILPGYYPDPSILRVGEDYYLVNSSFTHFPGLPVWHSKDLVHWTQIGNAVNRPSQADFGKLEISRGLFAPAINYHDGTFYIINTCVDCVEDAKENFLITAKDPAGPWSEPVVLGFEGIDPSITFENNGKAYIVNNGPPDGAPLYNGHRAIWMQEYDIATQKMVGPRKVIVNGGSNIKTKPIWVEGPHLFHVKGWYYLMAAEGGTSEQHSEVIFRSKKLWGPYVSYKGNPILTQRDLAPGRAFPVTSTGHADLVKTQKGQWYAVFLGTRPYADDFYNTGRETFMLPVTWKNGWPVILKKGAPVPFVVKRPNLPQEPLPQPHAGNFETAEAFAAPLGLDWVTVRTPREVWYTVDSGALNVQSRPVAIGSDGQPSFIGKRLQHANATVTSTLRFDPKIDGERAGLVAFQNSKAFYFFGLVHDGGKNAVCVTRRAGDGDPDNGTTLSCAPAPDGALTLQIAVKSGKIDFAFGTPGTLTTLVKDADATVLSTKKAGGFVGTIVGPYAYTPK